MSPSSCNKRQLFSRYSGWVGSLTQKEKARLALFFIFIGFVFFAFPFGEEVKETTIRNLTTKTISFTIQFAESEESTRMISFKPDAIVRVHSISDIDIIFSKKEAPFTYRLKAGRHYAFRYDEDDELNLYEGSHGRADVPDLAPFVPTPMPVVEVMLEMAKVDKNDIVYDLGCGDGRIVITAAKKYKARGVGVDLDPELIRQAKEASRKAKVEKRVEFRIQDAMRVNVSEATVVTLYLLPESNALLRPLLESQLKPGTFVVSHNYSIPGWEKKEVGFRNIKEINGKEHSVYLYQR